MTYDLEALDLLTRLIIVRPEDALHAYYENFRAVEGRRPTASETLHDGLDPKLARRKHRSWLGLVDKLSDLNPSDQRALEAHRDLLEELEKTSRQKSYKMLLLQAMISLDAFPGSASLLELSTAFAHNARRSAMLVRDVGVDLDDLSALGRMLEKNPINAWVGGNKGKPSPWFAYSGKTFHTIFQVRDENRASLLRLVEELLEWRISDYLRSSTSRTRSSAKALEGHIEHIR